MSEKENIELCLRTFPIRKAINPASGFKSFRPGLRTFPIRKAINPEYNQGKEMQKSQNLPNSEGY